jgi:hypothetical protein
MEFFTSGQSGSDERRSIFLQLVHERSLKKSPPRAQATRNEISSVTHCFMACNVRLTRQESSQYWCRLCQENHTHTDIKILSNENRKQKTISSAFNIKSSLSSIAREQMETPGLSSVLYSAVYKVIALGSSH